MAKRRTLLMRLLSWAANFTPNAIYYPEDLAVSMDGQMAEIAMRRVGDECSLHTATLALAIATGRHMPNVGDTLSTTIHSATNRGREIGSFRIHVERISDEEAANG